MDRCYFGCMIYRACPDLLLCNMSVKSVDGWNSVYFAGDLDGLTLVNLWLMLNGLSIWFRYMCLHDCLVSTSLPELSGFSLLNSIRCCISDLDTRLCLKFYYSCELNGNAKGVNPQSWNHTICVNCFISRIGVENNSWFREFAYPSVSGITGMKI
jgi:hypothetical protein